MLHRRPPEEQRLPEFDLRDQLQRSLGSSYSIIRELGGGGMSRVFLAQEVALGREVVLKVLPPELGGALSSERFQREVRVAAGLQHPHIVPLFAAGDAEGILYYTMPMVAGESLRDRLDRDGPLPVEEAIGYLRDVVDALVAAHARGIVHRDIKPDNVLITHRHAVVTDFGIAKALADAGGAEKMTTTGLTLGTPAYMAPEQATGESNVDHRADLYAVGVLAYEMLDGEPPFRGPNAQAVIAAHLSRLAPSIVDARPAVPAPLAAIIARCLEKLPADRFATATQLLLAIDSLALPVNARNDGPTAASRSLPHVGLLYAGSAAVILAATYLLVHLLGLPDWVLITAAALLAVGLPIILATRQHEERRTATGVRPHAGESRVQRLLTWRRALAGGGLAFAGLTVATVLFVGLRTLGVGPFATLLTAGTLSARDPLLVAEFDNRSGDSTLGPSVTEALRIDLSRSHAVRLLETGDVTAALQRMERDPALPLTAAVAREVAERAGAKAVVTGEIAPLGTGYSISVRLVNPQDGSTLLAERETATGTAGLIAAVDQLSRKLRAGIGESLRSIRAGKPLEDVTTTSLAALRKYSEGDRAFDLGDLSRARSFMEAAIALDSNFAMAHRKLSVILNNFVVERTLMVAEARRAFELRDRLPERERLQAIASYHMALRTGQDSAVATYRQLLETWPEDKTAINNLVLLLNVTHRFAEAEEAGMRGIKILPRVFALYLNTISALLAQNKGARADSVFNLWRVATPKAQFRLAVGAQIAYSEGNYQLADRYIDSMIAQGIPGGIRAAHRLRTNIFRTEGRLVAAARVATTAIPLHLAAGDLRVAFTLITDLAYDQMLYRGRPDAALRLVDSALVAHPPERAAPADRPYLILADFYARAGKPERAALFIADFDRLVDPEIRKGDTQRSFAAGVLSMARRKPAEALVQFRQSREFSGDCRTCALFEIGQAFEGMQQPDSALVAYESLVESMPWSTDEKQFTLAPALRRVGELYEAKGDTARALDYYGRMVRLWKDADPELQPVVQDVKKRMAALGAEHARP